MITAIVILIVCFALLAAALDRIAAQAEAADEREYRQRVREATWQAGDRRWDR